MVDARRAAKAILLAEEIVPFPNAPASIAQDDVDYVVKVDQVGDPSKISVGAARVTSNPRELLIARLAADVIEHAGYFEQGFSLQTGTGASSTAATRFLEHRMRAKEITASFALGGITGGIVDLHRKGLIENLYDTQSFDAVAAESLRTSPRHYEISTNAYANPSSKGAYCDRLDMVILATSVATLYHYLLHREAPYPWYDLPVLLGSLGGIGLIVGPVGLLVAKKQRDPAMVDKSHLGMDVTFLVMLALTGLTGMALLILRETQVMGLVFALHLGIVFAFFLTMPYGKFVHGIYRFLALVRYAKERRLY